MGKITKILLVIACLSQTLLFKAEADSIKASNYDSFWLWSGVKPQAVLNDAQEVYLLRGEIRQDRHNGHAFYIPQGTGAIIDETPNIWLVYRVYTLDWNLNIYQEIERELARWEQREIAVKGIQIDFDPATRKVLDYALFLQELRQWLPNQYQLSITGLLDWGKNASSESIYGVAQSIDEVIFQTYQDYDTIENYQHYLQTIGHLTIPFKIGLIQNGKWSEPTALKNNPYFQGYTLFLTNQQAD